MSTRSFLLRIFVFLVVTLGVASAANPKPWLRMRRPYFQDIARGELTSAGPSSIDIEADSSLADLLRNVSPESLHRLLHDVFPDRFRHGVWPSEEKALEAVYRIDAALATKLASMAKRQTEANTTTASTSLPNASSTTSSTDTSAPPSSVAAPTSTQSGQTGSASASQSMSTANTSQSLTAGSGSSSTTPVPAATNSDSGPSATAGTTLTISVSGNGTIPASVPSSTDTSGNPDASTTSNLSRSSKLVTSVYTSTNAAGSAIIVTATTYVNPDLSDATASATQAPPSLQSNGASSSEQGGLFYELIFGAVLAGLLGS